MIAIKADKLVKRYGKTVAVDGLDLSVEEGELFALLGVNGAGKTTAIKMLSCLLLPDGGSAAVFGHSITAEKDAVKEKINVSPQESAVAGNLTVYENLTFIAQIYGFSKEQAEQKAEKYIAEFMLEEVRGKRAKTLSGGYARRLSIAMALVSQPRLIFLDEPTLGLDVLARRALWNIIEGLKGKITVILTTHYLEEAEALSDRIGIMSKGKMLAAGTADELKKLSGKDSLEEAFISLAGEEGVNL